MSALTYLHLDVFTANRFEGNQLAVFPDPGELTTAEMQTIAQEMNFSETTFIYPPRSGGDAHMRIFTPGTELPIAGHPTIGSTFALAHLKKIALGRDRFVFELGVGPTPVSLEWRNDALWFAWMTQPLPAFGAEVADREAVAAACGVSAADLLDGAPIQEVSCGVPYVFVGLRSRTAVDAVAIDRRALEKCFRDAGLEEVPSLRLHARAWRRRNGLQPDARAELRDRRGSGDRERLRAARVLPARSLVGDAGRRARDGEPAGGRDEASEPDLHLDRL